MTETITTTKTILSRAEYLQLEGLKSLFQRYDCLRDEIAKSFGDIVDLGDEDCDDYDKGSYILFDNGSEDYNLKEKLKDSDVYVQDD